MLQLKIFTKMEAKEFLMDIMEVLLLKLFKTFTPITNGLLEDSKLYPEDIGRIQNITRNSMIGYTKNLDINTWTIGTTSLKKTFTRMVERVCY